jgi:hypothetical protein
MSIVFPAFRRIHRLSVLAVLPAMLLSAGCKIWVKQGSDEDEFAQQEQHCKQQTSDASPASVEECLHFSGWSATDLSVTADDPADSDEFD